MTSPQNLEEIGMLLSGSLAIGVQPISSSVVHAGVARGGNPLGLKAINQTWFVLDTGWDNASGDIDAHNATRNIHDQIEVASKAEGRYLDYTFMNDASWSQDVFRHYGTANVQRLRDI